VTQTLVRAKGLSKRFLVPWRRGTIFRLLGAFLKREPYRKEFWALQNLYFEIDKGEKLALIGKNGAGKTTLLRILAGIYQESSGEIEVTERPAALFRFQTGLLQDLPVVDNIFLFGAFYGIERGVISRNVELILETSKLQHHALSPMKELSIGQQQQVALSVFFLNPSEFLIFDESLSFIDQDFAHRCKDYFENLFSSKKTVILTSHDNSLLKKYCKTALWLDQGQLHRSGSVEHVMGEYERPLAGL